MANLFVVTAFALFCAMPALSQAPATKPNFSGKWAADMKASDFRGMPDLGTITVLIEHHEPAFSVSWIHNNAKGQTTTLKLAHTTDDRLNRHTGPDGWIGQTKTQWKGRALVSVSSDDSGAVHMRGGVRESWDLSPDGRTLTFVREFLGGERAPQKVIFLKQ